MNNDKQIVDLLNTIANRDFGLGGHSFIETTTATDGNWNAIKSDGAADAVFTTLTDGKSADLDGFTLLAGDIVYGNFTHIELASGKVIAYNKTK